LSLGNEGFGEFKEKYGFAGTRATEDEEFTAGFFEDALDLFVRGNRGVLLPGMKGAAADGLGQVFETELEPDAFVERFFEDTFNPGGADVVEDGLALALLLGGEGEGGCKESERGEGDGVRGEVVGEGKEIWVAAGGGVVAVGQDMEEVDEGVLAGLSVVFVVEEVNDGLDTLLGAGGFW
jgi:hypothetical protein